MSRRADSTRRSEGHRRRLSVHTPGPMALVWVTAARGVMAMGGARYQIVQAFARCIGVPSPHENAAANSGGVNFASEISHSYTSASTS